MRVYLASHFSRKHEVRKAVADLEEMGIEVCSTWHREKFASNSVLHPRHSRTWKKNALNDEGELLDCTHFVLFSMGPRKKFSRGSHCWENGFAQATGATCVVVGERQLIFHYLPDNKVCRTWKSAKRFLKKELRHEQHPNTQPDYDGQGH